MSKLYLSIATALCCLLSLFSRAQNCTVNAGIPQTICANTTLSLQGQANGSFQGGTQNIVWSQISGPLATITSPTSNITTVTGIVAGTYVFQLSAVCLDGSSINDNVTITVRPVILANAGADETYCPGVYALSGNSPSPGTGAWTIIGTNNGVSITSTGSPTSNVSLSTTSAGPTTLRWTVSQTTSGTTCTSYDEVVITNRGGVSAVNAGRDTTLSNCYATTQSVTMNASYAGTTFGQAGSWSQVSGPNSATITTPASRTSSITNLIQGSYTFRWTVSGPCANGFDDINVTVPPPTSNLTSIGSIAAQSFCDGRTSTVITATRPVFAGEVASWTVIVGSGSFTNAADYSTEVTGMASGTNTYRYRITNASGCTTFRDVTVNNIIPPTITINTSSPVIVGCGSNSTSISFLTTGGTGSTQYRVIAGPSGYVLPASWSNTSSTTSTTVYGLTMPGTYIVRLMRSGTIDCSSATKDVTVIVSQTPTMANAGTAQLLACNVTSTALAGNVPAIGTGMWSQVSGPNVASISNPALFNTGISDLVPGAYVFKWIINAGNGCTPSEDIVTVRVANTAPSAAAAGSDLINVCHSSPVQMNANVPLLNEVGTWSVSPSTGVSFNNINDPKAVAMGMAANTNYTFTWTIVNGCGVSSDNMEITTIATQGAGIANAGLDRCLPASTTNFNMAATAASPAGAVGTWTLISGPNTPSISNANSATTTVSGLVEGTYRFAWALNVSGCGAVLDTMVATISPALTTANAGLPQTICAANLTLAGNIPSVGSGLWSQISGPGGAVLADATLPNSEVSGLMPGLYKFRWTISSGVCTNSSDATVTVASLPTSAMVAADSSCVTRTMLNAMAGNSPINGIGTWSQISGPNQAAITNISSPTSSLSGLINGTYVFRWKIDGGGGCPPSTADMKVTVNIPTSSISNINACNLNTLTLTGNANIGGVWSQNSGPSTSSIQAISPNIGSVTGLMPGVYVFQFTPNSVSGCPALTSRTVTLTNSAPATPAAAGIDQSLCSVTSFSLAGNTAGVGSGVWSRVAGPNTPTIVGSSSPSATINGAIVGTYTYRWTITNGGCSSADEVIIANNAIPIANAGSDSTIRKDSFQLQAVNPIIGTGAWTQLAGPLVDISDPSMFNATVTGLAGGNTYKFRWSVTNGTCPPATSDIELTYPELLPVKFVTFTGQVNNGLSMLNWKTGSEFNVDRFEVERSEDGRTFAKTGAVAYKPGLSSYEFSELFPSGFATCYYRLSAVDLDGHVSSSSVIRISNSRINPSLTVVPNPVHGSIVIRIEVDKKESAILSVLNTEGKVIQLQLIKLTPGSQKITVDNTGRLPNGRYKILATSNSGLKLVTEAVVLK